MDCIGFKIYMEPVLEPVTASDMKEYLRIPSTDTGHDALLGTLISAARIHVERVTGRIFCSSTYDIQYRFLDTELKIPVTPVQSVTSVVYKISNATYTLPANQYELRSYKTFPVIVPAWDVSWPAVDEDSVIIRVLAGVAASPYDKIGMTLIKAIVADMYVHPESQSEISLTDNKQIERLFNSFVTR